MASSSQGLQTVLQIVLAIAIVVLGYVLYQSITEPYAEIERQEEMTRRTRERMTQVRTALVHYERTEDRYVSTLDSLEMWVKTDSSMVASWDSIFTPALSPDSLIYSPRTGKMFEYQVNDTLQVPTYLLSDPDSDDRIGTLSADLTQRNAESWN